MVDSEVNLTNKLQDFSQQKMQFLYTIKATKIEKINIS